MSLLESMIARLATQRACIDAAAKRVEHLDGPVLEIGLGKGRTYTHLRQVFPDREVFAFDKELHALPAAAPKRGYLVLGDFRETLRAVAGRLRCPAVLAHADFGTNDPSADAALARDIAGPIAELVAAGGLVLSDRALPHRTLLEGDLPTVDLPPGIAPWPYFLYRVAKPGAAGSPPSPPEPP